MRLVTAAVCVEIAMRHATAAVCVEIAMRHATAAVCVEIATCHPTLPCGVTERVCLRQKTVATDRIQVVKDSTDEIEDNVTMKKTFLVYSAGKQQITSQNKYGRH